MTLYPHQVTGAKWLSQLPRAALFDEQGLGKTITVIEAMNLLGVRRIRRTLVICPTVVLWNWKREMERWSVRRPNVQVVDRISCDVDVLNHDVVIVTHGLLIEPSIYMQLLALTWDLVVLDEAHFFRTRTAKRTRLFYGDYSRKREGLTVNADRVWLLTGTPMPNDVRNLWTMCWGLWPERFPAPTNPDRPMSFGEFETRYCVTKPTLWGKRAMGNRNVAELRERLSRVVLRRRKKDCLDLPPLRYESIVLRPEKLPHELELLDTELTRAIAEIQHPEEAFRALGRMTQISTYRRLCGLAKVEPVVDYLNLELEDPAHKLVVFAHHTTVIDALAERLAHYGCVQITGDTPAKGRHRNVDAFQFDPSVQVALCQIVAGGTGVTLTEAADVVFVELSWVPGENAQAADRVHRIGQQRACRVRFVSLVGTIDEHITETLVRKTRMIREVVETKEQ